ncbi:hypothetical protein [Nesterenkonia halophila]|uniref:hypothetical protein n=1 Tax=Nesterenkonia halophila TaxID=302044 RepID=UPI001291C94C|nr:hypothetical protein [Nesterenkonia halophila]
MKFDMGNETLGTLAQRTEQSGTELTSLVRQLAAAADPLQGRFNGQGRAQFDSFKSRVDEISHELNSALTAINRGQAEMDAATRTGDHESAANAERRQSAANFDAARFAGR